MQRRQARVDHALSDDGSADDYPHRTTHLLVILTVQDTVALKRVELLLTRLANVLVPQTRVIYTTIRARTDGLSITRNDA